MGVAGLHLREQLDNQKQDLEAWRRVDLLTVVSFHVQIEEEEEKWISGYCLGYRTEGEMDLSGLADIWAMRFNGYKAQMVLHVWAEMKYLAYRKYGCMSWVVLVGLYYCLPDPFLKKNSYLQVSHFLN